MIRPTKPRRTDLRSRSIDADKVFIKEDGSFLELDSSGRIIIPSLQQVSQTWKLAVIQITSPTNDSVNNRFENTFALNFPILTDSATLQPLARLYLNGLKLNEDDFVIQNVTTVITKTNYQLESDDEFEIWYVIQPSN